MKDKCGTEIEPGCVVDVFWSGMLSAFVTSVEQGGLLGANGRPEPAKLVLQVAIPMRLNPGEPADVYVTRPSDKPKTEEKESVM